MLCLTEGRSSEEREEEKDDIEPYESVVSAELNEKPEMEIIEARELDREMAAAEVDGEERNDEEAGGTVGNWSNKGAIQAAEEEEVAGEREVEVEEETS